MARRQFITQRSGRTSDANPEFMPLLKQLMASRLGYDLIDDEGCDLFARSSSDGVEARFVPIIRTITRFRGI
jgi:hypothetical protein